MGVQLPTTPFTNLQVNGEVILSLAAGERIRIVNIGGSTLHLDNSVDGADMVSAALTIEKLS